MSERYRIRWASPSFDEREERELIQVMRSGNLTMGAKVRAFETAVAERLGVRHAVAVSSGTAALDVALKGLGIGPGHEVIVPAFTYIATVHAVSYQGATPIPVDIDPGSLNLDPAAIRAALTARTRCIITIDYGGSSADYDVLERLARDSGVHLLQDGAHSIGGAYRGRSPGGFGVGATLSFHIAKVVTSVEGGMLVTDHTELAECARELRNQGEATGQKYFFRRIGHNYRMSDLHAAVGLAQLGKLPQLVERRREVASWYRASLAGIEEITLPVEQPGTVHPWFFFSILLADSARRNRAVQALEGAGIETRVCWPLAVYQQEAYAGRLPHARCPHAESAAARVLSLPMHGHLSRTEVEYVCATLRDALERRA